jgi:pimeloyl-ACP methyl ester carboxylesterase
MRLVAAAAVGAGVIAPPMLFPVFAFPVPSGPYAIGTVTYHWVDASRRDAFVSDPVAHRELIAQVWYPARAGSSAPVAAYVPEPAVLAPLAGLLRLPPFIFGHLNAVTTNARVAAAPAGTGRFPVLICLHGRGGYRQEDTWLVEELVSRGYAVVCLDQPHAASGVDLPDGRRVLLDPRMLQRSFVDAMVPYLAQDVSFTVDRLVALASQDPQGVLTGRLDLSRVGVFGLSLGGEVAAQACRDEPRLQACVMMDVWMPQDVVSPGLTRPALFLTRDAATMRSEGWPSEAVTETLTTMRAAYAADRAPAWFVTAPGLYHQDFSDAPLLSPLTRTLHVTGPIPAQRAHDITADYTAAFFDVTLRRTTSPLLSSTQRPFPGVSVESRAGTETDGRGLS